MKYKDYYAILGIDKNAGEKDIKKAYRKLARKFHPDINHDAGAEQKFKEATEAYDVIGDPEKRKKYDELGANWKAGQDFSPPPGWRHPPGGMGTDFSGQAFSSEDFGGFSDFFSSLFGGAQTGSFAGGAPNWRMRGQDHEASMDITLEEAVHGTRKGIALQTTDLDENGRVIRATKNMQVSIPPGTGDHSRIRLAGQGGSGMGGAPAGHLYLRVHILPHPRFQLKGRDLQTTLQIPPYDAALGARVMVQALDGHKLAVNLPAGTSSGAQLRLKGRGLPASGKKPAGDLLVQIKISVPKNLSEQERTLYEELKKCAGA
ncbi:MAG: DnaJ C-terminal domain-containing protein [Kiritimatiellae bacterium]|nr:DnaJ C-terminal domain-containing protein [Kiritimatiellia bacterium]